MKQSEIVNLSAAELQDGLSQLKKTYTDLKSAHAISPIENPLQIRSLRRSIARVSTELSKRELQ
ncbi:MULTISPECIES: 50S ribosomal protein L29 [unclassified Flavobacterium]|uniref:50S ribosomal protein L29 n=1 Tax=unclassified Flavobacterium TaxID=196869 RepID=UPI001C5AC512|nr:MULTISPECIES: 50S ribosomal protein L29 [unclassified Flavobacterium]MBW3517629.1 50S ribosomal protein L29 [Flavobacterium sp. NKUCC04_CG]MCP1994797.1 large subunit ribosomal protein L29 [Flavobacterium sp. HSC-61S13]